MKYSVERFEHTTDVRSFLDKHIDIDRFLELCKKCPNYDNNYMCPPFKFQVIDFWKRFKEIRLIGTKITPDPSETPQDAMAAGSAMVMAEKKKLMKELWELEKEHNGSVALFGGNCNICAKCAKMCGESCRHPELARHSIESLGANVTSVAHEYLGLEVKWIKDNKLPEYMTSVAALLIPYI